MQVQINLDAPFEFTEGDPIKPFNFHGDLFLITDPGKTNMAMAVGTPFGTQLCILQFRAPGSAYDTSDYCRDFKDFIKRYFDGCKFSLIGIEQAISKSGMNHHHSSMVLTEIRANLIDLAFSLTGSKPLEINNWTWKYAILPDGMRSQTEKGSVRFLPDVYNVYGNADVTDVMCMYRYVVKKHGGDYRITPNKMEQKLTNYKAYILPAGSAAAKTARRFNYERKLSFEENCAFYINRTWEKGVASLSLDAVTLEDIYNHAVGFVASNSTNMVEVVVVRL